MHPIRAIAEKLLADRRAQLVAEMKLQGIDNATLFKIIHEKRQAELPIGLIIELTYVDAYAKILNLDSYPQEKADWKIKDYVGTLVDDLYEWLDRHPLFLDWTRRTNATHNVGPTTDDEILSTIALLSIKREDEKNDEPQEVKGLPDTSSGGSEP